MTETEEVSILYPLSLLTFKGQSLCLCKDLALYCSNTFNAAEHKQTSIHALCIPYPKLCMQDSQFKDVCTYIGFSLFCVPIRFCTQMSACQNDLYVSQATVPEVLMFAKISTS